jgi:FkbM family methyltransferase
MNPLELINRIGRRLGIPISLWKIRDNWINIRDGMFSLTPVIVANEIRRGFYDVSLKPGDTVIDLGAHVGLFSIPLALENPGVQFICYEPNYRNYRNLLRNIRYNRAHNIVAVNAGVAPKAGFLATNYSYWNSGGSTCKDAVGNIPAESSGIVPSYPLAAIFRRHGLTSCAVLKIDIEGGEYGGSIQPGDPMNAAFVVMEIHGNRGPAASMLAMVQTYANDYRAQVIESDGINGIYTGSNKVKLLDPITATEAQIAYYD